MNKQKKVDPHEPDWDAYLKEQEIIDWEETMAMMDAEEEEADGNHER